MARPSFSLRPLTPILLNIFSICCLIIIGLGMRSKENHTLQGLYFFRASTKNFVIDVKHILDENIDNTLLSDLENANLDDFYTIGLWNYCSGTIVNGKDTVKHCSSSQAFFSFQLQKIWASNLKDRLQENFPKELAASLKVYNTISSWMTTSYLLGIIAASSQLLLGVMLTFCCVSHFYVVGILSMISTFFIFAASSTMSGFYASLTTVINKKLGGYGIECTMGRNLYILIWLATVSSLLATLFWATEICCCTAKISKKKKKNKISSGFHFQSYQRVESRSDEVRELLIGDKEEYKKAPKVVVNSSSAIESIL